MQKHLATLLILFVPVLLLGVAWFYRTPAVPRGDATFADVSLRLDYATTSAAQELGLGGRATLPERYGMLFVFDHDDLWGIWMKGMRVPIDIFWLDDQGRVIAFDADIATSTYPSVFYPPAPAKYVLETAAGFAAAHDVATGTPLDFARGEPVAQ